MSDEIRDLNDRTKQEEAEVLNMHDPLEDAPTEPYLERSPDRGAVRRRIPTSELDFYEEPTSPDLLRKKGQT